MCVVTIQVLVSAPLEKITGIRRVRLHSSAVRPCPCGRRAHGFLHARYLHRDTLPMLDLIQPGQQQWRTAAEVVINQ